jgi:hypothetical protein
MSKPPTTHAVGDENGDRLLAEAEHVERIVVLGECARDEAVVLLARGRVESSVPMLGRLLLALPAASALLAGSIGFCGTSRTSVGSAHRDERVA